ncbi:DUF3631 domain-containing protein [Mycobacterium colombiense]|uniref:DUF3631 domain-containing protein n=1 Tax=Mycobacterium colombiense TaxID=339268 RepID=UPI0007FDD8AC|nr:DUF3631 domain-containing protein [Mycobacterium colombiense]OBJ21662.1 hypothetical protein A9W93_14070 [Mycobacterium colombiense]
MSDNAVDGGDLLDIIVAWFDRFIAMPDRDDLNILALWTVHTHLAVELHTSPRLMIDSLAPGSGKTTLLEHLKQLCYLPIQAAGLASAAVLTRVLQSGTRTILLDEVDRTLRPDGPLTNDLLAILNTGYRVGGVRVVSVPTANNGWEAQEMRTFAPVAMAGNAPHLPDDTVQRSIRVLLMPDLHGTVEDSDWEEIENEAKALQEFIAEWADRVRPTVKGMRVPMPEGCVGRFKEKWRPLKRVAVAAGGEWPHIADHLIQQSLNQDAAEREAGLKEERPGVVLLRDLHAVWPADTAFVPTQELVGLVVKRNPEYWGAGSSFGRPLTDTRFGRMIVQACKATSSRPKGRRGFARSQFEFVWHQYGISRSEPDELGKAG